LLAPNREPVSQLIAGPKTRGQVIGYRSYWSSNWSDQSRRGDDVRGGSLGEMARLKIFRFSSQRCLSWCLISKRPRPSVFKSRRSCLHEGHGSLTESLFCCGAWVSSWYFSDVAGHRLARPGITPCVKTFLCSSSDRQPYAVSASGERRSPSAQQFADRSQSQSGQNAVPGL
jgi:hypothetical protein